MSNPKVRVRPKTKTKTQKPRLYKVILLNDDYTPREFVVRVLKAVFKLTGDQASRVMITAHMKGLCLVSIYAKDIAESKAAEAIDLAKQAGFPLNFVTEPED